MISVIFSDMSSALSDPPGLNQNVDQLTAPTIAKAVTRGSERVSPSFLHAAISKDSIRNMKVCRSAANSSACSGSRFFSSRMLIAMFF